MQATVERGVQVRGSDNRPRPLINVSIQPKTPSGYMFVGIGLGIVLGFIVGTVATVTIGEKSVLLAQHLWNRLLGIDTEGERVHFELLLQ